MGSGTDWYDLLGAHDQPCQNRAGSFKGTRGGVAIMLGSDTDIEWIEGMETADAIRRDKKKEP